MPGCSGAWAWPYTGTALVVHRLRQFRGLLETREHLLANLEGVDREIQQKLTDLIKCGEGIIESETDIDLLLALSLGAPTVEALLELTGLPVPASLTGLDLLPVLHRDVIPGAAGSDDALKRAIAW